MEKSERYKRLVDNDCIPCGYNEPCDSFIFSEAIINMLLDKISQKDKKIKILEEELLKEGHPAYRREHRRRSYLENIEVPALKEKIKLTAISELEEVNGLLTDTIIEVTEKEFNVDKLCYLEEISSKFSEKIKNKIEKIQGGNF